MSRNIYCDAKLFIENEEITYLKAVTIVFSGNSKLNYLNATFSTVDLESYSLYNKKIRFYLNESGPESTPYFSGYIMDVSPKETTCSIKAIDPRCFLSGKESKKISITNKINFDGYTLPQFVKEVVDENLGIYGYPPNSLGTKFISETANTILMKDTRVTNTEIYSIIQSKINKAIDDADIEEVKGFFMDIVETEDIPQIVIKETKSINNKPSLYLSYNDGLTSVSYTRRAIPSYGVARSSDQSGEAEEIIGSFQDGNMPLGYRSLDVSGNYKDPDTAKYNALLEVYRNKESLEIKTKVNKGFKTPLGSIVYLDVDDLKIRGNHKLISKRCNWSPSNISLNLNLGRIPPIVSDYI